MTTTFTSPYLLSTCDNTIVHLNQSKFIIGRSSQSSHVLNDSCISKTHCIFEEVNGNWMLTDKSQNGLTLNQRFLPSRLPCAITDGDTIKLPNGVKYVFVNKSENNSSTSNLLVSNNSGDRVQTSMIMHAYCKRPAPSPSIPIPNVRRHSSQIASSINIEIDTGRSSNFWNMPSSSGINIGESPNMKRKIENIPGLSDVDNCESSNKKRKAETQTKPENEDLHCIICTELFIKAVTLGCSHTFCNYCIETWKRRNGNCPVCRTEIDESTPAENIDNLVEKIISTSEMDIVKEREELIKTRNLCNETNILNDDIQSLLDEELVFPSQTSSDDSSDDLFSRTSDSSSFFSSQNSDDDSYNSDSNDLREFFFLVAGLL